MQQKKEIVFKSEYVKRLLSITVVFLILFTSFSIIFVEKAKAQGSPNYLDVIPSDQNVTIGDSFYTLINVTINWEINNVTISNITFQPAGIINYTSPTIGNLFSGGYWWTPTNGTINNESGYAFNLSWINITGINGTGTSYTVANITWHANNVGIASIRLTGTTRNNSGINHTTSIHNATVNVHPQAVSDFSAVSYGATQINLTWTTGVGVDKTHIVRKQGSYPSGVSDGTVAYNDSGTSYEDSGLSAGVKYYYKAWSYNATANFYSLQPASVTSSNITISGRVRDAQTYLPLSSATGTNIQIMMQGPGEGLSYEQQCPQIDDNGNFSVDVTSGGEGKYEVMIMRSGYVGYVNWSMSLSLGDSVYLDVLLEPKFEEGNYSCIRGRVNNTAGANISQAEIICLDTDFSHMLGGEGDEDFEMPQTYTNANGNFSFDITYRSTYLLIAFRDGYYAAFSPSITIDDSDITEWKNFTLDQALPDTLNMTVRFTDLDDAVVTVNRTIVAASPMFRFALDFNPESGNNNQNVSQAEVTAYLAGLTRTGPTVNASLDDEVGGGEDEEGGGEEGPDFLTIPVSILLDGSNFDSYVPGSHSGNLDNLVNTSVNSNQTIYYNATFNITLDGLILNQTSHKFNVTAEFNNIVASNITFVFGNLFNISTVVNNDTNGTISYTNSNLTISPGGGSVESLAYANVTLALNESTISLPIIEVPTWHLNDQWTFNDVENGTAEQTSYTVVGKALRSHERMQYSIGGGNASYLSYIVSKQSSSGSETNYVTVSDLDWINCDGPQSINYLVNDVDFPLYNGKTWYPKSWWGQSVNATVMSCSEVKATGYDNLACVRINYVNSTNSSHVVAQEWYSPALKFFVNRTRYYDSGNTSTLNLTDRSLAAYIESITIYANDSDSNGLINSLDFNVTINGSGLASATSYVLEGPIYKQNSGWNPPTDITFVWEEDALQNLDTRKTITLPCSGSLINARQVDGPYTVSLELREAGQWGPGQTIDYTSIQTEQYTYTQFEAPAASVHNYSDYGNDTNSNGQYDYLTVNLTLNVTATGNYSVNGGLNYIIQHGYWDEWRWITGTGTETFYFTQDSYPTVQLNFRGSEIYEKGYNGQYSFHIEIMDEDTLTRVAETQGTTTNYYSYNQFSTPSVYFNKTWMEESGQHDYINSSTYLTINTSIVVAEGAFSGGTSTYDIHGGIHFTENNGAVQGGFITGSGNQITLSEGENIVPLNFNIGEITDKNSTYVGNFSVNIGFSERIGDWIGPDIDNVEYITQNYSVSSDFPEPPISMRMVNDTITGDNNDYLTIRVYVNISSDTYANQTYDLHACVHYVENDYWYFITGLGEMTYLNYGTNTLYLNFSGMEISASGKDGPYIVWAGLDSLPDHEMIVNHEYTTAAHLHGDFASPGVQFGTMVSGQNDSINGSDYLTVNVPIIVNDAGNYHIHGGIHWIQSMGDWDNWVFITGTGNNYQLGAGTQTIQLNFDQGLIRNELESSSYSGVLKVHIGIEDTTTWQPIANKEYTTQSYSASDFSSSAVTIDGAIHQINENGNLVVNLSINVTSTNQYIVHGGVHWVQDMGGWDEWHFITGTYSQTTLSVDDTYKEVTFNGGEIYNSMQNGPYMIWIGIENSTTHRLLANREISASYNYADFAAAAPAVRIDRNNMSDGTVDYMNTSGSTSYLTVNVSVIATSSGTYWLDGGLHDSSTWEFITGNGQQVTLSTGRNTIPLNFNAGDIYSSGYYGTYKVHIGVRDMSTWTDLDHYEYTTQSYSSDAAPAPPIQFGTMSAGQCDYLNSTYITVNVTVNVSSSSYAGEYDLHGGIHYLDSMGWWYHLEGTGSWVTLSSGTNTVPLNFNAGEVRRGLPDGYNDNLTVWIGLNNVTTWEEVTHTEYTTKEYAKTDLPGPRMTVTVNNETVNGSYFTVNLTVNVSSASYAGEYDVHGGVHWIDTSQGWQDWRFITGTGSPRTLAVGDNNINLNFNAGDIYTTLLQEGYNGKLTVWVGVQNMTTWEHVTHTENTSADDYSAVSFSPPGLTITCNGDYNNNSGTYLTVNATINASASYQNTSLDIHAGIHYTEGWEWRFITGYGSTVNLTSPSITIPINFNGASIRASEHNGSYEIWVGISESGQWEDLASNQYTTTDNSYSYSDFAEPVVRIISSNITDYNNNSEYITVNVTINAAQTGNYFVEGCLHWKDGYQWKWIAWKGKDVTFSSTGEQIVKLDFDGKQIAAAQNDGWTGGTLVAWFAVMNSTTWNEMSRVNEYTTSSYSPTDFSSSPITFNGSIFDTGVNISGESTPYTHLNVTVPLNISDPSGTYKIFGGLFDAGNNTLIVAMEKSIDTSLENVTLNFTGTKIYKKQYNGTYKFKAKIFDTVNKYECDNMINTTNAYNYNDFTAATPEAAIVACYNNFSNFTNSNGDIVINVTFNISQASRFEICGDLFDNTSTTYVANARNDTWFDNQTGNNITGQLVFNGSAITSSSVSAPYKLAYLRLSVWNEADQIWEELQALKNIYYTS